jgi:hypothetical protein
VQFCLKPKALDQTPLDFQVISRLFMMSQVFNSFDTSSGRPSLTFRQSQLLAVQAFRDELGPQDALLLQVAWL